MPKAVVDTNVFVSGIIFGGNPARVLRAVSKNKLEIVISPEIETEILEKLEKFHAPNQKIKEWKQNFENTAQLVIPKRPHLVSRDVKDNKFLAAASEARAEFIVTGDKDLLVLGHYETTAIVTSRQMLEILGEDV